MANLIVLNEEKISENEEPKNITNDVLVEDLSLHRMKLDCNNGSANLSNISGKRTNYLNWDDYFMAIAYLTSMRSKDPCTQVGACIVNKDNKVVALGYNGMPIGCSDDEFSWKKGIDNTLENKHLYVCHAELNAVVNKNSESLKNCTIYVGLFPCNECAKVIIQSGIKKIFYLSDKHAHKLTTKAAKKMFDAAKIEYRQYKPKQDKIMIDFSEIN